MNKLQEYVNQITVEYLEANSGDHKPEKPAEDIRYLLRSEYDRDDRYGKVKH